MHVKNSWKSQAESIGEKKINQEVGTGIHQIQHKQIYGYLKIAYPLKHIVLDLSVPQDWGTPSCCV